MPRSPREIKIEIKTGRKDEIEITFDETQKILLDFRKRWKRMAADVLDANDKNATGNLKRGISPVLFQEGNKFGVKMEFPSKLDYAAYVDKGVQGAKSSRKAPDSPFRFGSGTGKKGTLLPAIRAWIPQKGISNVDWRDKGGRFLSYDSMARKISRSIYLYGIKPTPFITEPLEKLFKKYAPKLEASLFRDIKNSLVDANLKDHGLYFSVDYTI
jgi:hypothetical protein